MKRENAKFLNIIFAVFFTFIGIFIGMGIVALPNSNKTSDSEDLCNEELHEDILDELEALKSEQKSNEAIILERRITVDNIPYDGCERTISCWGDSMMYGCATTPGFVEDNGVMQNISYTTTPDMLEQMTGIETYNLGVNGETSEEIARRAGGLKMVTDRDIVITGTGVAEFKLVSENGDNIWYDDYSGYNFSSDSTNICSILDKQYYITNNNDGESHILYGENVNIPEGTPVYTLAAVERRDDILILEIGSNSGWNNDYNILIDQYDSILQYTDCHYYIIVGDTDEPALSADENEAIVGLGETKWEQVLSEAYGEHFLNLRHYMIQNGLSDCGLTATDEDLKGYTQGNISNQLRSDWTHFNAYGYYSKAKGIYQKGIELGYWE